MACHLFPYFSNSLHSRSSSSAVQGPLPARGIGQYSRREGTTTRTDGRINSFLVTLCTLIIGSPRECLGNLIPSLATFYDRFEESSILLRCPTTFVEYKEGECDMRDGSFSPFRSLGSKEWSQRFRHDLLFLPADKGTR